MSGTDEGQGCTGRADRPAAAGRSAAVTLAGAAVVAAVIGVRGEFPLSDDWSYAYTVRELCTTGELRLLPWTGASLVLQAWYGAALCRVLGFSFTLLRASTVVIAAAGAVGFVLLLRRLGIRGAVLAVGTAVFALNPLHVNLAFTFMTDVPFVAAAVWAGYAYVRGLGERRTAWLVLGGVLAAAALLIRQHGALVALAAAAAVLLDLGRPRRARLAAAAAAAALPLAVLAAFHLWLFAIHGAPLGYAHKLDEARRVTLVGLVNCTFRGVEYLGLFLCPLLIGFAHPLRRYHPRLLAAAYAALGACAVALLVRERALMFYLTNVLYDFGLGPLSLRDTQFLGLPPVLELGPMLGVPLTLVATVAAARGAAAMLAALPRLREPVAAFLLLATVFLFAGTLLHARYYFDRYLLAVLPFAIAATLVVRPLVTVRPVPLLLAAALAWYAVAGTHDYLAWNRARHAGLGALLAEGASPRAIDGGVEFNAWHLAPGSDAWPSDAAARVRQPPARRSWWWVIDDRFVASFRPLAGYHPRLTMPFRRWLPPGTGHVLILERDDEIVRPVPTSPRAGDRAPPPSSDGA